MPVDSSTVVGILSESDDAGAVGKPRPIPVRVEAELSPIRTRVVAIVQAYPGSTIQDVARLMGFSHPTSAYHLSSLCVLGLVSRTRDGRVLRHYAQAEPNRAEAYLKALERDERRRPIIQFLRTQPVDQITINQLRHQLGLPYGLIKRTLAQLEREGLVRLHSRRNIYIIEVTGVLARGSASKRNEAVVGFSELLPTGQGPTGPGKRGDVAGDTTNSGPLSGFTSS